MTNTLDDAHSMTPDQETHLANLKARFTQQLDRKYRQGQLQHGGNLWDMTPERLLDEAIQEAIDQYTYLMTLKENLQNYNPTDVA